MINFKEYFELFCEMARPVKSFDDPKMNQAYGDSLKKFKQLGVNNANTYTIWDFIFKLLPRNLKTVEILSNRKKYSGTLQRNFILNLIRRNESVIDFDRLALDINNIEYIKLYINRPILKNNSRRIGKSETQKELINRKKLLEP